MDAGYRYEYWRFANRRRAEKRLLILKATSPHDGTSFTLFYKALPHDISFPSASRARRSSASPSCRSRPKPSTIGATTLPFPFAVATHLRMLYRKRLPPRLAAALEPSIKAVNYSAAACATLREGDLLDRRTE